MSQRAETILPGPRVYCDEVFSLGARGLDEEGLTDRTRQSPLSDEIGVFRGAVEGDVREFGPGEPSRAARTSLAEAHVTPSAERGVPVNLPKSSARAVGGSAFTGRISVQNGPTRSGDSRRVA
ncbi:conserved hypothetical protein [Streptomyces sviceus ATCC 29083]|uniref:Uncharacterized protein n=1 Tax=Streptomyces sviceus (strain ATCC 29083 / DSM 924 / JCM 4929 / NBRC 13980 / NCIMB 11184 / NRRL 5439 / UC 5370) TaxID=463191 RepID=B5I6S4_STRX2|nr:conserved hypothetical protein [Streptomyces sviceus ATCC 29083]